MLVSIFFVSFVSLFFLRKVAKKIDLVDLPSDRKRHLGAVPLVGGIAITTVIVCILSINPDLLPHSKLYLFCIITLATLGALDDKFDLKVSLRMGIQIALAVLVVFKGNLSLSTFGNLLGTGDISLGPWGLMVTIIAVIGAINAFNMVDGIDGLLGGLAIVTFGSLGVLYSLHGHTEQAQFCWVLITAILPYIAMNLGCFGRTRKVFMGDAGSMVIGFTVVWLLMGTSQTPTTQDPLMKPVTALWVIMIPLMDMAAIMVRRIQRGHSPLKPDREHLHHIFQRIGFSSHQTLMIIVSLGIIFAAIGIYGEYTHSHDDWMFWGFIGCFAVYYYMLSHVWIITKMIRTLSLKEKPHNNAITADKK